MNTPETQFNVTREGPYLCLDWGGANCDLLSREEEKQLAGFLQVGQQDWYSDILEFHTKFKHHIGSFPSIPPEATQRLRRKLIREEVNELLDAMDDEDLVKIADGGGDSIVVILGTMISYGIDLRPVWKAIHESNMAKSLEKRADGKTLKPEGWKPPDIESILACQKEKKGDSNGNS